MGEQLVGAQVGALPDLGQFFAHFVQGVQGLRLRERFAQGRPCRFRHPCRILMQPALHGCQTLCGKFRQARTFLGVGTLERFGVARHHVVAIGDDGLHGLHVDRPALEDEARPRRHLAHLGQPQHGEHADVEPADVELPPFVRQACRRGIGVMVVVQLFAADDETDRQDVGGTIGRLEIAIAPVMPDAVDDAGRGDRYPEHLHGPDRKTQRTEQQHIDDQGQAHALPGVMRIHMAFDPVVGRAMAVFGDGFLVPRFGAVQLGTAAQHRLDAARDRRMRIIDGLAFGVMLAVDGDPFLGDHAGGQPQPEPEEMRDHRMQIERTVRLRTVQKDGDRRDGDMRRDERVGEHFAPRGTGQAVAEKSKDGINQDNTLQRMPACRRTTTCGAGLCRLGAGLKPASAVSMKF